MDKSVVRMNATVPMARAAVTSRTIIPRLPRSLFGQILLALLIGIVAAQAVGAWLLLDERARLAQRLLGSHAAQRIAGVIDVLDGVDRSERERLVRALSVPPTRIRLDTAWETSAPAADSPVRPDLIAFAEQIRHELDRPLEVRVLALRFDPERPPWARNRRRNGTEPLGPSARPSEQIQAPEDGARRSGAPPPPPHLRPLLQAEVQAQLTDGTIVTFQHLLPGPLPDDPLRVLGWIGLVLLIVAGLAIWIVRKLTRPLRTLATAADGLAHNLDQEPLPETGPLEVAAAARAFNTMQSELRRTLRTRASALAAVSHDLRLPLTRLRLRIESLRDPTLRGQIEGDIGDMEQMITHTLDFLRAGKSSEQVVALDLMALIENTVEQIAALGATIHVHGTVGAPVVGRPIALSRCLANVLDNARRYGGPDVDVTVIDTPARVEVYIEDHGPGIAMAERENVFEPFVRLETSRSKETGGTGLGLAIARRVARMHGGDVTLEDRIGGGLTVRLTIARSTNLAVA